MLVRKIRNKKRLAAAAVEAAMVLLPLTTLFMGIFEYGRLLMDWNVLNNAARAGCRFALVNNTSGTISSQVQTLVTNTMGNESNNFSNFTVTVSGVHAGTTYTGNNVSNLVAGDLITVTVSGQYKFLNIIPLVHMPASLTISSGVTMVCEGVT